MLKFRTLLFAYFVIVAIFSVAHCLTHWKVTDSGRIESNKDSAFTLTRPYDLAAFIKQVDRYERLNALKQLLASQETINKRDSYKNTPISVANYQENFYKNDQDCINAGQQLAKFSFHETHFLALRSDLVKLPQEIMDINQDDVKVFHKPDCETAELPFTMETFDHLESIQMKENITMLPEVDISSHLLVESEDLFGHLVNKALRVNHTSWVYLKMASDYYRVKGDYDQSVKCLQRAVYFAPKRYQSIPLLSLANMLHKLHFNNDSLVIGLTGVSVDSKNPLLAYYVANIYVTLGQLNTSYTWFNKAVNLDPQFKQAVLKKYAVACHIKLQLYLEEQHINLEKKLEELNSFQKYSDEWLQLNTKLTSEKSSANRKRVTQNFHTEFLTNSKSTICDWHMKDSNEFSNLNCKKLPIHFTHFTFQSYDKLLEQLDHLMDNLNATKSPEKIEEQDADDTAGAEKRIPPVYFREENNEMLGEISMNLEQVIKENMAKSQKFSLDDFEF